MWLHARLETAVQSARDRDRSIALVLVCMC